MMTSAQTRRPGILLALLAGALLAAGCGGAAGRGADDVAAPLSYDSYTAEEAGFYVTSTLIYGPTEGVLVDGQFTLPEGEAVAEWVAAHGVSLSAIWITHGHPDHYFGLQPILEVFPGTPVYASADVVAEIEATMQGKLDYWGPIYGEALTTAPIVPQVFEGDELLVDGTPIDLVDVAQGDTEAVTVVYAPTLDLLVTGDVAFQGVHVWLADASTGTQRHAWRGSIAELQALEPQHVVAGHRVPGSADDPRALAWTSDYIDMFEMIMVENGDAAELEAGLIMHFSDALLPVIAQISAAAAR